MKEVVLGEEKAFGDLPAEVDVDNDPYFLVRDDGGEYKLLSRLCPHAGGYVMNYGGGALVCPLHYWEFDACTGSCTTVKGASLDAYPVTVREGVLVAEMA